MDDGPARGVTATMALIKTRMELNHIFTGKRGSAHEGWCEVGRLMASQGFQGSVKHFKVKWDNLVAKYKDLKIRRLEDETGQYTPSWPYFQILDHFLEKRLNMSSPSLIRMRSCSRLSTRMPLGNSTITSHNSGPSSTTNDDTPVVCQDTMPESFEYLMTPETVTSTFTPETSSAKKGIVQNDTDKDDVMRKILKLLRKDFIVQRRVAESVRKLSDSVERIERLLINVSDSRGHLVHNSI